jgi:hypothetical protein
MSNCTDKIVLKNLSSNLGMLLVALILVIASHSIILNLQQEIVIKFCSNEWNEIISPELFYFKNSTQSP